ncbi:hypothetical protein OZX67_03755 [Bifidobacterium sp. ESL0728]|uniref:hypothetical protein n=1 Tax=Bifidobacterium sp. ESL0728 TaxID=2983220 RepID=UPI0023F842B1|nr:hypothetical protein [Bifidobacterium sp. ESL0728]WEV59662.1 hypothetical protein OZX67_03755 [Bifidobacterium sp. ESL0728]
MDFPDGMPWWAVIAVVAVQAAVSVAVAVIQSNRLNLHATNTLKSADEKDRADIEEQIKNSPTIKRMEKKFGNDYEHFTELDKMVRDIKLLVLRGSLLRDPRSRAEHEDMLANGREYIGMGGNGVGHIRYRMLQQEYRWRAEHDDWDYSRPVSEEAYKEES